MRLQEIETRMSAIKAEIEAEGADLNALETEINSLKEERKSILDNAEKRTKLLEDIAAGKVQAQTLEEHTEIKEERKHMSYAVESAEYRAAFLKGLQGKELNVEERAAINATAAVPTSTMNKIFEKLEQTSALYSKISVSEFPNYLTLPVENATDDAAWVAMGTAATDGADSLSTVSLSAYKLIKTLEIGADVMAMSIDAFENYIVSKLYKKIGKAVENAILNGTGTSQPKGILAETLTSVTYTKAAMTYKDLVGKIIGGLGSEYAANGTFVTTRAIFFGEILGMQTTDGKPVCVADPQSPAKFNILGYPVIIDDRMPVDTILFGDLSYYAFNWAKPVEISNDKSVGYRTGSTVYRALALADGKTVQTEAFIKATRATA